LKKRERSQENRGNNNPQRSPEKKREDAMSDSFGKEDRIAVRAEKRHKPRHSWTAEEPAEGKRGGGNSQSAKEFAKIRKHSERGC